MASSRPVVVSTDLLYKTGPPNPMEQSCIGIVKNWYCKKVNFVVVYYASVETVFKKTTFIPTSYLNCPDVYKTTFTARICLNCATRIYPLDWLEKVLDHRISFWNCSIQDLKDNNFDEAPYCYTCGEKLHYYDFLKNCVECQTVYNWRRSIYGLAAIKPEDF